MYMFRQRFFCQKHLIPWVIDWIKSEKLLVWILDIYLMFLSEFPTMSWINVFLRFVYIDILFKEKKIGEWLVYNK